MAWTEEGVLKEKGWNREREEKARKGEMLVIPSVLIAAL